MTVAAKASRHDSSTDTPSSEEAGFRSSPDSQYATSSTATDETVIEILSQPDDTVIELKPESESYYEVMTDSEGYKELRPVVNTPSLVVNTPSPVVNSSSLVVNTPSPVVNASSQVVNTSPVDGGPCELNSAAPKSIMKRTATSHFEESSSTSSSSSSKREISFRGDTVNKALSDERTTSLSDDSDSDEASYDGATYDGRLGYIQYTKSYENQGLFPADLLNAIA